MQVLALICLAITSMILAYLVGHKKGMREGVELGKAFGKLDKPVPPPTIEQLKELLAPILRDPEEEPGDAIHLDNYRVFRGGVIFRGGLEIALVDEKNGPFEFDRLHDIVELKEDFDHCRRLSRLWFEDFGVDAGFALRDGGYFVSKNGMFWQGDLLLYRLGDNHELEEWPVNSSTKYFKKPDFEDCEACSRLLTRWKAEFRRST